jgi:DNA modification methylase
VIDLILGDCLEAMKSISDSSIDLVVTSPPYDNLRDYNNSSEWNFEIFTQIAKELLRVLKTNSCVVWIVNDATIKGSETGSSFKQALYFKEIGFNIHDTMIWNKISAFQHKNRYIPSFEYMFVFSKGFVRSANLILDRKNIWGGTKIHGTERMKDGSIRPMSEIQRSKQVKEYGYRSNIWNIPPEKNNKTGHPAVFPIKLAEDHIKTWSNEGRTVLDPFMGSGTTGLACKNLNRNFIGIEKDETYFNIAFDRIFL